MRWRGLASPPQPWPAGCPAAVRHVTATSRVPLRGSPVTRITPYPRASPRLSTSSVVRAVLLPTQLGAQGLCLATPRFFSHPQDICRLSPVRCGFPPAYPQRRPQHCGLAALERSAREAAREAARSHLPAGTEGSERRAGQAGVQRSSGPRRRKGNPVGTEPAGDQPVGTGRAGTGRAGTGSAGTGRAGTGSAGTGRAGARPAGTASAGTGRTGVRAAVTARNRGQGRLRAVTLAIGAASVLAGGGIAYGLPGAAQAQSSVSSQTAGSQSGTSGSTGSSSGSASSGSAKSGSSSGTSSSGTSSSSGLKSSAAPSSSSGSGQVTSGGS
jgi:hypothetical protein